MPRHWPHVGAQQALNPMSQVSRSALDIVCERLAILIPLALGVFTAAPESWWLDSPEFTASAWMLGIPHPPGHPLWVMLVKPFTLLPFGTIAFRVSLSSAVFGALAAGLLYKMISRILLAVSAEVHPGVRALLSLAAALAAVTSHAWWFQCNRQEVYALQILLVIGALFPLVHYCLQRDRNDLRWLAVSAFVGGLGLSSHHFITLSVAPAIVPPLVALARYRGGVGAVRQSLRLGLIGAAGLLPYLFLPLRTLARTPIALGGVHSLYDFWWVVSARVYQKSMTAEHLDGLDARTLDILLSMMHDIGPLPVVLALAGFYLLLRRRSTRMAGLVLFTAASVSLLLRAIMGHDLFNPDYYGYLLPLFALTVTAAAAFFMVVFHVLQRMTRLGTALSAVLIAGLLAFSMHAARRHYHRCDLSQFHATRHYADAAFAGAPQGSIAIVSYFKTFFVLWAQRHVDGHRMDIQVINPHLFGYPGYLHTVLQENKPLLRLARSLFVEGTLTAEAIADLATEAPLRVEPAPWFAADAFRHMLPDGVLYRAMPEPLSRADVRDHAPRHFERMRRLYTRLGEGWRDTETWRMLAFGHYLDAVFFARQGDRESALQAIGQLKEIGVTPEPVRDLEDAILREPQGAVDVIPLLQKAGWGEVPQGETAAVTGP